MALNDWYFGDELTDGMGNVQLLGKLQAGHAPGLVPGAEAAPDVVANRSVDW